MVDDQPGFGALLQRVLPGFEIMEERDPLRALGVARRWRPHLFILDILMPRMDGRELAHLIERDDRLRHTPILFLSALVECDADGEPVLIDGHSAFGKPFNLEILQDHVTRLVAGRAAIKAVQHGLRRGLVAGELIAS